ncbi:MAG: hypothetical protein LUO82_03035 [Methanomicrobiales archaeon]|nr:hypothetical protein [Methanomicrobiales archaeon]
MVILEHQERLAIALLGITVIVIVAGHLVFGTVDRWHMATPFTPGARDGDLVVIEGAIERITHTQDGGHLILNIGGVTVFIPHPAGEGLVLYRGDRIRVLGIAQTYQGEREVKVSAPEDIVLLE